MHFFCFSYKMTRRILPSKDKVNFFVKTIYNSLRYNLGSIAFAAVVEPLIGLIRSVVEAVIVVR